MTSGKQDHQPKGSNMVQFGNKRFRSIVQEMSNWKEAHRIKTNASKSDLMFLTCRRQSQSVHYLTGPADPRS